MKSLTGLDATFLYLETPEMPMHVGSFNLCELPAGFRGSFHKAVKAHIGKRMHLAPVFSRKLVAMPLDLGHPLWVDADEVDISFHIRRADPAKKGAPPMTLAAVHKLCAQLHGELIDRNFPLWEFHIFDRIQLPAAMGGKVVAGFFSKIHHAALDGKGGVMLANAMLDMGPVPREVTPPDPARRRKLASDLKLGKMIGSVFSSSLAQLAKAARALPLAASALGSSLGSTLARQSAGAATGSRPKMPMKLAPATPFNAGVGTGRVFVTATIPLAECKAMGKAVDGSLNDMLLWICSTALRSYLTEHHTLPKKSLVAAMPVSLREAGASDTANLGNQVSMSLVELGTHLAHPLKRMNAIMVSTAKVKSSVGALKGLLPTDYPSLLAPWLVGGAAKMALNAYGKSGLASRLPMVANLAISNVPGPPVPLYLAGAQFLTFHPLSIIMHGLALNITIQTYAGHVDFGIVADKKALPHAKDLAAAIEAAFREAQTLLGTSAAPSPVTKARKTTVTSATGLEKSPSVKRAARPKISSIPNTAKTSNASSHGTTPSKAGSPKTRSKAGSARRSAA
ncbi:MAG: wax ester/triacylglycerol synthase family O-acyltransferase [Polaromonas sp.]|uniref:wax ester/triacylglycerol synthase family O-acyltransferase n=1 Tax=Polaromonas sp. TaxID=1869339 RepID=UPI0017A8456B|nr:wax ester/triacylglycerol synthase family O-acyltransferase [Polaromonas sp.]MBA3595503.1 wax ester/triacylglycerol synthase family O-acyltransferase [Polaromonas sp.]